MKLSFVLSLAISLCVAEGLSLLNRRQAIVEKVSKAGWFSLAAWNFLPTTTKPLLLPEKALAASTTMGKPVSKEIQSTKSIQKTDTPAINTQFVSAGYGREEYTNSIIASRDTNISPKEVYDTILKLKGNSTVNNKAPLRALDVGAGAGVSTQVLWDLGYHEIDALDWSGVAWQKNVEEEGQCPPSVRFYELDDERFMKLWRENNSKSNKQQKYDVIAFNFAVNPNKALMFSKELLKENGALLAPINVQTDYWMRQVYTLIDTNGKILWSANEVGAWSVLFQPDVTQDTCQGIWCSPYNGFKKLK